MAHLYEEPDKEVALEGKEEGLLPEQPEEHEP